MKNIYQTLGELQISYKKHEHPAVFTCEESQQLRGDLKGVGETKNLFLRNKRGDRHYLVSLPHDKQADLKALWQKLGESKLSFASPERLMQYLGLTPGSVSLLGLINDKAKAVTVILDADLWSHQVIGCHPNINTATLEIRRQDMDRFLAWCGNEVRVMVL